LLQKRVSGDGEGDGGSEEGDGSGNAEDGEGEQKGKKEREHSKGNVPHIGRERGDQHSHNNSPQNERQRGGGRGGRYHLRLTSEKREKTKDSAPKKIFTFRWRRKR
jgi:hypothetical protein